MASTGRSNGLSIPARLLTVAVTCVLGGTLAAADPPHRVVISESSQFVGAAGSGGGGEDDLCDIDGAEEVWRFTEHESSVNDVAVTDDGFVYTTGSDDTLRRVDPDGSEVWSFEEAVMSGRSVVADGEGYAYFGTAFATISNTMRGGVVRKVSPQGTLEWEFTRIRSDASPGGQASIHDLDIDLDDGAVYAVAGDRTVRKINRFGTQSWSISSGNNQDRTVAVNYNRNVFIGDGPSGDETIRKVDRFGNPVPVTNFVDWSFSGHEDMVNDIAVGGGGYLHTASRDTTVRQVNMDSRQEWVFDENEETAEAIAVDADGYAYVGTRTGVIQKLGPDGEMLWEYAAHDDRVTGLEVDATGYIYSSSTDGSAAKLRQDGAGCPSE
ncbi:WD40 repeat, subgroup (plasmid) [Thioalkalivibrio sp. K90mix]|uniref:outer membrane protein assembly factor BamB family protein n=1 Tax=Thioalkalivibrio sp. (strain K90mix) TaxID=396595 RepID=UPI000195A94D|nr:PQQ-binding-like beta-propeller repeat protein [Thioalkalivibrio sp. K90mix]ADC73361.1 WD40 repeat, subgroup [Thioalkalivibrio sp. K90mix]